MRAALFALCCAATAIAQDARQQPTFKTGVQLVRIDVSVLDGKRQPLRGLRASDFSVLEDGQPRPIRSFQAIDQGTPPPAGATGPVAGSTGVTSNQAANDTSRLIFILMDRSIPAERPMLIARQIADAAVDAMAPGDEAAIVSTGTGAPQNLTSDRARLHKTIAAANWSETVSQTELDDPNLALIRGSGLLDVKTSGACLCGVCTMDLITQIANQIQGVPRRKVLLLIGSDITIQVGMDIGDAKGMSCEKVARDSRERLFDALQTSGLTVHAIDPQGLASVGPATRASASNNALDRDGTQSRIDFTKAQGDLGVLPELTGGRTVLNSNEPFRMVPEVLHESDAYYLLAFEPIEGSGDVRHRIEVKVARKGVNVHTARYLAPSSAIATAASRSASPLDRAIGGLLPEASLPLGMAVASFAGTDASRAYVGVTLDASAFAGSHGSTPLEIAVQASDERGRRVGAARQSGTVEVPESAAGLTPFVELQTYLSLAPGDYELRTAVMNATTQEASSVFTHITVPSFDGAGLSLSDLVLGTRENHGALPEAAPSLPIVPTTARVFSARVPAWVFLRVYQPAARDKAPAVDIETTVLDGGGKRVKHQSQPLAFAGRTADVRLALPLKDLAPGRYVLRVAAKQGRDETSRSIGFAVDKPEPVLTQEHSPELDAALAAAAHYLQDYEHRISAIGAEEEYEQSVTSTGVVVGDTLSRGAFRGGAPSTVSTTSTRKTRANVMAISLGQRGWVSFRDVFELDGRPVRDRVERLSRILQNINPDSLGQARQIADESARYNLQPQGTIVDRTINVPMTALYFMRAANQPRSVFTLGNAERVDGILCTTLQFVEQTRPRLIGTKDGAAAQGTVWIDMANGGRILKTELRVQTTTVAGQSVRARSVVTYGRIDTLDLWLPVGMNESYELTPARQTITGHATYSDYREFKITTSENIK